MAQLFERVRRLLPGLWAGFLLCVALVATPALFATLLPADAGRVAARILVQEAYVSLLLGAVLLVLERTVARREAAAGQGSQFSTGMVLALGTVFCTVLGYFAVQTQLPAARLGQGALNFGQLHAVSALFFGIKGVVVLVLAWRALAPAAMVNPAASS
jgi:hypothetical protein